MKDRKYLVQLRTISISRKKCPMELDSCRGINLLGVELSVGSIINGEEGLF
jgi:hypothetical protein